MKTVYLISFVLFLSCKLVNAQFNNLIHHHRLRLPKDTLRSKLLLHSLDQFLLDSKGDNSNNKFILKAQQIETCLLLDEMREMNAMSVNNTVIPCRPYLTNLVLLDSVRSLMQISFLGHSDTSSFMKGSFELFAHQMNDSVYFSSTLHDKTRH